MDVILAALVASINGGTLIFPGWLAWCPTNNGWWCGGSPFWDTSISRYLLVFRISNYIVVLYILCSMSWYILVYIGVLEYTLETEVGTFSLSTRKILEYEALRNITWTILDHLNHFRPMEVRCSNPFSIWSSAVLRTFAAPALLCGRLCGGCRKGRQPGSQTLTATVRCETSAVKHGAARWKLMLVWNRITEVYEVEPKIICVIMCVYMYLWL